MSIVDLCSCAEMNMLAACVGAGQRDVRGLLLYGM